jgi:putative glutamine amidotransferase
MGAEKPLVGVVSDRRQIDAAHYFHMIGEKYLHALADAADVYPVGLPSLADGFDLVEILGRLDGLFLPGSPSNLEPKHYRGDSSKPGTWHDPERDIAALPLIPAAVESGLPLFAVCRGFQEMNVAYGGTLHQLVHEVPGYRMHKENPDDPLEVQYGPSHTVSFARGGLLEDITGHAGATVNSLHSQAVDRIADGLIVEATAEDGLVEAFVVKDAPAFALGIQWHPEWQVSANEESTAIFRAFGDACRKYRADRH